MNIDKFIETLSPEQIESLKSALFKTQQKEELVEDNKNDFRMNKSIDNKNKRKEPVRAKENTWVDTGEKRDIITPEFTPVARTREAPEKIKIKCHICGRMTEVDNRFVYGEFYRCNNCTG
ncbi:MAG: hypothetical protein EBU90_13320 [Proteobacteria bacterium]|nr:hypothetical protein [Pseudomonadota bacterium]NBP15121.1 hypothetical protein [bacterium]